VLKILCQFDKILLRTDNNKEVGFDFEEIFNEVRAGKFEGKLDEY